MAGKKGDTEREILGGVYWHGDTGREILGWGHEKQDTMARREPPEGARGLTDRASEWEGTGRSRAGISKQLPSPGGGF